MHSSRRSGTRLARSASRRRARRAGRFPRGMRSHLAPPAPTPEAPVGQAPGVESSGSTGEGEVRVTTIELFFDLVFVFTITQLTALLASDPTGTSLAQVVLMLVAIWWMYAAFAWLTNAVTPDRTSLRLPLLAGMACFFVISLVIPTAFSGDGVVFAVAYLGVIAIHTALYTQSASWSLASVWSFARMNVLGGLFILAGTIIGGGWEY